jgi:1-acyl-sn-glycerol-3-phosphate acyltransferase
MNDEKHDRVDGRARGFVYSFVATFLLWLYFLGGGIFFVLVLYLPAFLFLKDKEKAFQRLNSIFYQVFFFLVRVLFPMHTWQIDEEITKIKSSVILCNHVSYLDPLILIALFNRQKTIVKSGFFNYPVFGWLLRVSGYLPAITTGRFSAMMIDQMEKMDKYLESGGILFVFPEGTRSRSGELGELNKGAFKIARLCKAPLTVITICNSDKLFPPGKFLFMASAHSTITVTLTGRIEPDYEHNSPSPATLEALVRQQLNKGGALRNAAESFS